MVESFVLHQVQSGEIPLVQSAGNTPTTHDTIPPRLEYASEACRQCASATADALRISKEISGNAEERETRTSQGRGEYEFCELGNDDPTLEELVGRRILIKLPSGKSVDTGCIFNIQGGKRRIRTAEGVVAREVYPIWHAASILMLPRPNRDQNSWGEGLPVMRNAQYGITHLHMRTTELLDSESAIIDIEQVDVANHYSEESIDFTQRFRQIEQVWQGTKYFDEDLSQLITEHKALTDAGHHDLGPQGGRIVATLQKLLSEAATDYGISEFTSTLDVLPSLLQIVRAPAISQPPSIDAIPPEEVQIRRRDVKQWRQWAVTRGASSYRFRKAVRKAYKSTCLACGLTLPNLGGGSKAGVDAAHILPWATYDVDEVSNGICLCKLHHWAFDEGLLCIECEEGSYSIIVPPEAVQRVQNAGIDFSLDFLRELEGEVPNSRLPRLTTERPNPEFLRMLREITSD